jgi:phosphate starvation-inducible protein PhoH
MALTVATRIGKNCHMAFNGDESQVDIKGRTGLPYIIQLVYGLEDTNVIRLTSKHIQRHPLVKEIIKRAEQAS